MARGLRQHTGIAARLKGLDHHNVQPKPIGRKTSHQVPRYVCIHRAEIWGAFISSRITGKEVLKDQLKKYQ
jgi:hypothetical protein